MFHDLQWCEARMYHIPLAFQYVNGCSNERGENGDEILREGKRIEIPGLLYADDLTSCGESEDLKGMVGRFVEVCKRGL